MGRGEESSSDSSFIHAQGGGVDKTNEKRKQALLRLTQSGFLPEETFYPLPGSTVRQFAGRVREKIEQGTAIRVVVDQRDSDPDTPARYLKQVLWWLSAVGVHYVVIVHHTGGSGVQATLVRFDVLGVNQDDKESHEERGRRRAAVSSAEQKTQWAEQCSTDKCPYVSEEAARQSTVARSKYTGGMLLRPYRCPKCKKWHLTKKNAKPQA